MVLLRPIVRVTARDLDLR